MFRGCCGAVICILWVHDASGTANAADVTPIALLRGAAMARSAMNDIAVSCRIERMLPTPVSTLDCEFAKSGDNQRMDLILGGEAKEIVIRRENIFWGYRRKVAEDLCVYDLKRSTGVRGDMLCDPRLIGVTDVLSPLASMSTCFWYQQGEQLTLLGTKEIEGHLVWRVLAERRRGPFKESAEYWVEEPSFRVFKVIWRGVSQIVEVSSHFDGNLGCAFMPSRVGMEMVMDGRLVEKSEIVILNCHTQAISPSRFTMAAMDLPQNTPINDYRVNRIIGYWDGVKLADRPVKAKGTEELSDRQIFAGKRLLLILANVAIVVALLVAMWRRRL